MSAPWRVKNQLLGKYKRFAARTFARRPLSMRNSRPLVSFTFDDFPRSALYGAGALLERFGLAGTYYTSLGLMGKVAPTGEIFHREDLPILLQRGHELGCHTFDHCPAHDTPASVFERSIAENQEAISTLEPSVRFRSLSYPIGVPSPEIKRRCARHFIGCRAGGQTYNSNKIDLNYLSAFFLEQSRENFAAIRQVIEENRQACGWLIFATHDVCASPTRYGCEPALFEAVLRHSIESGAIVVPVSTALEKIGAQW